MLYITSLVFITGSLDLLTTFIQIFLFSPASQIYSRFLQVCFWGIIDLQGSLHSWDTSLCFDIYTHFKCITTPPHLFIDSSFFGGAAEEGTIYNCLDSYSWLRFSLCLDAAPSVLSWNARGSISVAKILVLRTWVLSAFLFLVICLSSWIHVPFYCIAWYLIDSCPWVGPWLLLNAPVWLVFSRVKSYPCQSPWQLTGREEQ